MGAMEIVEQPKTIDQVFKINGRIIWVRNVPAILVTIGPEFTYQLTAPVVNNLFAITRKAMAESKDQRLDINYYEMF